MSIDRYPDLDHADRQRMALPATGLGAASLLARNDDSVWPEFAGRDLVTRHPGHRVPGPGRRRGDHGVRDRLAARRARDGDSSADTLVTLTAGGNDLLSASSGASTGDGADAACGASSRTWTGIVDAVRGPPPPGDAPGGERLRPDGRHRRSRRRRGSPPREMRWLRDYNAGVARCARRAAPRSSTCTRHFAGHGRGAPPERRWYWTGSLIEPGVVGASEIRRLWLAALDEPRRRSRRRPRPAGR